MSSSKMFQTESVNHIKLVLVNMNVTTLSLIKRYLLHKIYSRDVYIIVVFLIK